MSFPRSSTEKPRSSIDKSQVGYEKDGGGLHVVDLELPTIPSSPGMVPPRYSFLSTRRFSAAPFRRPRQTANQTRNDTRLPTQSAADVSPLSPSLASATASPPGGLSDPRREGGGEKEANTEPEETILDRRLLGWTWRRWAFIIGPLIAVVVMAVVLAAVFVSRNSSDTNSSTSPPSTPTSSEALPTSTSIPTIPIPSNSTSDGVMKGTGVVSAVDHWDKLFVYYQNAHGDLAYVALHQNNTWEAPWILPMANRAVNNTALTAFNWKENGMWKTNLIYQDESGLLRNMLYNSNQKQFNEGLFHAKNISLPTTPDTINRMSWANITGSYNFLYYSGTDGALKELTINTKTSVWGTPHSFPNSNGYAGSAVSYDGINNIMTLHTISSAGQLQMYWRNYTDTDPNSKNAAPAPLAWNTGGTLPNAKAQLGINLNVNSTLSYSPFNGDQIFVQADDGSIWRVGWTGTREKQQYTTAVATGLGSIPGGNLYTDPVSLIWHSRKDQAHVFIQQQGGNLAHAVLQDDGSLKVMDNLPS